MTHMTMTMTHATISLPVVSPKYQTAVGLGIGMVCAPFLWTVAVRGLLKTGVGVYVVAEVVHLLRESPFTLFWQDDDDDDEEDTWFTRPAFTMGGNEPDGGDDEVFEWELDSIATTVRDLLETWRQTVRDTVQSVRQGAWDSDDNNDSGSYRYSSKTDTGALFPPHLRTGVILGTVIGVLAGA